MSDNYSCNSYREASLKKGVSRRDLIRLGALGMVGWVAASQTALSQIAINNQQPTTNNVLVVLFLRGGMDGLNAVVPYADEEYYRLRPSLGIGAPNSKTAIADRAIDLDGFFGFHPVLKPMLPLFEDRRLAIVHAVGSGDQTRSHFEAMNVMERGLASDTRGSMGGWLARYLKATESDSDSPMRAVALTSVLPDSLLGATHAVNFSNLNEYRLDAPLDVRSDLAQMYSKGKDAVSLAGIDTLNVLRKLEKLNPQSYKPNGTAAYPDTELGNGFKQVAMLIKNDVGLEVACLDRGGWDTHVAQGAGTGLLASHLDDVAKSLAAFAADMGKELGRVTVVVMTEFGRRTEENTGLGTDHGRGSCMFVLGGGVKGGKVYGDWPGLKENQLEGPGDLRVTTDYRDVLSEVLLKRMSLIDQGEIFPGHKDLHLGLVS